MENYVYDIDSIRGLNLNMKVPLPLFAYIVEEIFKFTLNQPNQFTIPSMLQIFERESVELKTEEQVFCLNSLLYLTRFT